MIYSVVYTINASYSSSSVKFFSDGKIEYFGESREVANAEKESSTGKISKEQFAQLEKLIEESGFLKLEKEYSMQGLSDGDTIAIRVKTINSEKSVSCYGFFPPAFLAVQKKIEELWPQPMLHVGF
jgi:hypothetical protein